MGHLGHSLRVLVVFVTPIVACSSTTRNNGGSTDAGAAGEGSTADGMGGFGGDPMTSGGGGEDGSASSSSGGTSGSGGAGSGGANNGGTGGGEGGVSGNDSSGEQTTDSTSGGSCVEPERPISLDGQCVPCGDAPEPDAACAALSGDAPVCVDGSCHPCGPDSPGICGGTRPVCGSDFSCVPCRYHDECPESACHITEGRCFSPGLVAYVDPTSTTCPGTGTQALPYCEPDSALAAIPEGGEGVVVLTPGTVLDLGLLIEDGRQVALFSGAVRSTYVRVRDATLYLQNTYADAGVLLEGESTFYADYSAISAWETGTMSLRDGSRAVLRSSSADGSLGGITVGEGSTLELSYSTVIAPGVGISCNAGVGELSVSNSIVLTESETALGVYCSSASVTYSALSTWHDGEGNVVVGHHEGEGAPWFSFVPDAGFRLTSDGSTDFRDIGRWEEGDPRLDIDGQPRPTVPASTGYPGHDIP